jgi:hypothetical protein
LKLLLQHQYAQKIINSGIDTTSDRHTTPLHLAVQHDLHETVLILTRSFPPVQYPRPSQSRENQIQLSALSAQGETPLHSAVNRDEWDMIQILLTVGADLSVINKNGKSVFDCAKTQRRTQLVRLFEDVEIEPRALLEQRYLSEPKAADSFQQLYDTVLARLESLRVKLEFIHEDLKDTSESCVQFVKNWQGELCRGCNQYLCLSR